MSRFFFRATLVGLLTASLGLLPSFLPFGPDLEESLGLQLLFTLRGPRSVPPEVVVVSIDRESAEALSLPGDPLKWPRSLHAQLTDILGRAGAAVVVFDMFFDEGRSAEDDRLFADAMGRAGNVVLSKYLLRETVAVAHPKDLPAGQVNIERLISPMSSLERVAVGAAPFPLPKVPVRVNQYWTFKAGAGGIPTLPVVAFQIFALDIWEDFVRLLEQVRPDRAQTLPADRHALIRAGRVEDTVAGLRTLFETDPGAAGAMLHAVSAAPVDPRRRARLRALVRMYQSPESQYLNFYGHPGTITTISYHRALRSADPLDAAVRGKAVFVGMSEYLRPEQKDGFYTVFSREGGLDISGVEIAATAFANMLEDVHVRPLPLVGHAAIVVVGGMLLGFLCAASPLRAAVSVVALSCAYLVFAQYRFSTAGDWYPLVVPLVLQIPTAFVCALLWRYVETNRARQKMQTAFSYYLPAKVIAELVSRAGADQKGQLVYGICLASDAERYTSLADSLSPAELANFLNAYYAIIFEPVKRHGGIVSDVVGDATLAIWAAATPDSALRAQACQAACDIDLAIERFNEAQGPLTLPTRIGLHFGPMILGNVGTVDHYEYRAVGDTPIAATRIERLNKRFHTRILASEDVVNGLDGFLTRRLGTFLLAGKSKPLAIHQLVCRKGDATPARLDSSALFAEGLAAWEKRSWHQASERFATLLTLVGKDEPARFYLRSCEEYKVQPPTEAWDGVIRMDEK